MSLARLSPSDVAARPDAGDVEIAGRVAAASPASATIADAFASVEVALAAPVGLAPGDLVILAGTLAGGEVQGARLVDRTRPRAGAPAGESDRLHARGVGRGLRARARALAADRAFFEARGFLEVDTPAIVPSPGLDVHLDAFAVPGASFGGGTGYLVTSPEYQMKRLLAGGVPRAYQACHAFRAGEVGDRHNPEFTMLEWYRAFAGVSEVVADTEALVRHVARALGAGDAIEVDGARVDLAAPFERLPVAAAFARFAGVSAEEALDLAVRDEDRFFRLLVEVVEPALAREARPVFLVDYPAPFASLARLSQRDPRVAERFEPLRGGGRNLQRLRGADRSRRAARAPRPRPGRAAEDRQARLPDRRTLPRRARGGHAALRGQRARPRPADRGLPRRHAHRRGHGLPRGLAVSLARLAYKYERLGALRRARARGEPVPEPAVFKALAREFPGCLNELDTLPMEDVDARALALGRAAQGGAVEPWVEWLGAYHALLRAALRLKPRVGRGAALDGDRADRLARDASEAAGAEVDAAFVHAVASPPGGRLNAAVFAALERRFGRPAAEIKRALFPRSRR